MLSEHQYLDSSQSSNLAPNGSAPKVTSCQWTLFWGILSPTYSALAGQTWGAPLGAAWSSTELTHLLQILGSLAWHFSCKSLQAALQGPSCIILSTTLTYSYPTHRVMQRQAIPTKSLQQYRGERSSSIMTRSSLPVQCPSKPECIWQGCSLNQSLYRSEAPDFP